MHAKKFLSLIKGKNRNNVSHERANWLKNLSDTQVHPEVIDIVSLGPNFSHTRRVSKDDVLFSIKNIEQRLYSYLDVEMLIKNDREKVTQNLNWTLKKQIQISTEERNFTKKLIATKKFLKNNPNIVGWMQERPISAPG